MPTVMRIGSYRFFFYSNEGSEPPHIHIQKHNCLAKFWLNPVQLASSTRFTAVELRRLEKMVEEHQTAFEGAWNEYFA